MSHFLQKLDKILVMCLPTLKCGHVIIIFKVGLGLMVTVVFKDILCIMSKVFFKCIIFSCRINVNDSYIIKFMMWLTGH